MNDDRPELASPPEPSPSRHFLPHWWPVLAQLVGVVVVAIGCGLLAVWLGVVAGGVGLAAVGTVAEIVE